MGTEQLDERYDAPLARTPFGLGPDADPPRASLPVRLNAGGLEGRRDVVGGTRTLVSVHDDDDASGSEVEPDAVGRGWVTPPGGARVEALFVLAGASLGIGRTERVVAPVWLALSDLVNLDAIGDPVDGLLEVEISMADGTVIGAGWPEPFCDAVVAALRTQLEDASSSTSVPDASTGPVASPDAPLAAADTDTAAGTADTAADGTEARIGVDELPSPPTLSLVPNVPDADADLGAAEQGAPDVRFDEVVSSEFEREADPVTPAAPHTPPPEAATGVFSAQPVVRNRSRRGDANGTATSTPSAAEQVLHDDTPSGSTAEDAASSPADVAARRTGALELEDVVYLGGYPGQTRKRKKCTAVLSNDGLEVAGPGDLQFRIAWDAVKTVEAQNSDEARFRMNTKIHRDSSALVVECDQGVTILLEARDCPTIPLRSAIGQLLVDLPVVVV
jgi:hypothetical protein